jgi:putative Holliday junction resolvase
MANLEGNIIAFDFGLKHTGVAVGQTVTRTARGVTTLSCRNGKPNWHTVATLFEDYNPVQVVVGLPLNMDDSHSVIVAPARAFAAQVTKRTQIPTVMHDERLTSKAAKTLFEDAKALGQANTEHELAACLILESWLAEQP